MCIGRERGRSLLLLCMGNEINQQLEKLVAEVLENAPELTESKPEMKSRETTLILRK